MSWDFICPRGWQIVQLWGQGYCVQQIGGGLRVIIDCEEKSDGHEWLHVSVSRKSWTPTHEDMQTVKTDFIGAWRYAYAVWPPVDKYVNIHPHCLHLWARLDGKPVLPEFSAILEGVRSI
jgi:hypothetical protein